jgi:hypothetical protein
VSGTIGNAQIQITSVVCNLAFILRDDPIRTKTIKP